MSIQGWNCLPINTNLHSRCLHRCFARPVCWVLAEIPPASLLRTEILICDQNTGDESASIALHDAYCVAIEHLLSQRSGHNSGALGVPEVNREIQPRRVFWRVNKAAAE